MSSFSKFKISFVLCLALLFSFAFAGTITINGLTHNISDLTGDYSITSESDTYVIYKNTGPSGNFIEVKIFNENELRNFSVIGWKNFEYTDNSIVNQYCYLAEKSNDPGVYDLCEPRFAFIQFNLSNGNIRYNYQTISSSSFPLTVQNSNAGNYEYYLGYEYLYSWGQHYSSFEFYYSPFSIYEWESNGTLGDVIYSPDNPGGIVFPPFSSSLTSQEINDGVYGILTNSSIKNQLPSRYSKVFVIYNEDTDFYQPYYVYSSYNAIGTIGFDENDEPIYQLVIGMNISVEDGHIVIGGQSSFPIYVFYKGSNSNYDTFATIPTSDFIGQHFSYDNQPLVYSNFSIPFYSFDDGQLREEPDFTISYSDITSPNGTIISAEQELLSPKDDTSIWEMLYNLFNPPSGNSNTMSTIENQHNQIIEGADYNSFNNYFDYSKSLIGDLSEITWLITANNLLFNYFSSFLILCCVFITISRVLR